MYVCGCVSASVCVRRNPLVVYVVSLICVYVSVHYYYGFLLQTPAAKSSQLIGNGSQKVQNSKRIQTKQKEEVRRIKQIRQQITVVYSIFCSGAQ